MTIYLDVITYYITYIVIKCLAGNVHANWICYNHDAFINHHFLEGKLHTLIYKSFTKRSVKIPISRLKTSL